MISKELNDKIKEAITVRGIASSLNAMSMPSFDALQKLLEMEGYSLTQIKNKQHESDTRQVP